MGSIEKSPLLSSKDLDDSIKENDSTENSSKSVFVVGLLAASGWVCFNAVSAICVQVSQFIIINHITALVSCVCPSVCLFYLRTFWEAMRMRKKKQHKA